MKYFKYALMAAPLVIKGAKALFSSDDKKEEKNKYNKYEYEQEERRELERRLSYQLESLRNERNEMERANRENLERIRELQEQMRENMEEQRRREIERERDLIEKERIKKEKEIEENKREQEAILKCKESLNNEYMKSIFKALKNFDKEEEKWLNSLSDKNIQNKLSMFKKNLVPLFQELYIHEQIGKKLNRKFMNIIKNIAKNKELKRMNFMIIGPSGVGKSTLINELFGEKLAKEGTGKRCTEVGQRYESKNVPFLTLYDSVGTEIGKGHTLEDVQNDTLGEITNNLNINDPNEHIHCIIYCTTSNRIFEDELKVILKIREVYDGKKLPIVIACTRATDEEDVESKKKAINDILSKEGEKISDDIFGITFVKVHAREKESKSMLKKSIIPCFGLGDLIDTCYKKGEKSYSIAIKNSLIEIAKNCFMDYIKKIKELLLNEINFYLYLTQKFEPNFSDFISFCFEKISDVENQKGINQNELKQLAKYVGNEQQGNYNNINENEFPKEFNNLDLNPKQESEENFNLLKNENNFNNNGLDLIPNDSNKSLNAKTCIICEEKPVNPFKCNNCETEACEKCYLSQFEDEEDVTCMVCGASESYTLLQQENNLNKINIEENYKENGVGNEYYNIFEEKENEINEPITKSKDDDYNYVSNKNILKNNLGLESRNTVSVFVEQFKNEMIEIISDKFEEFIKTSVQNIYYELLDKYKENILDQNNNNINMRDAMKDKDELKEEAATELKNQLKEPSEENFLKRMSSNLYQDIVNNFSSEMENNLMKFINDLNNNEEIRLFFESFEEEQNKNSKQLEEQFNKYIKDLRQKESESHERALKIDYEDYCESMQSSSLGESIPSSSKKYQ